MAKPLILVESSWDWYEVFSVAQPCGEELAEVDRDKFNFAFESYASGNYDRAFKGFLELSGKGSSVSQYILGAMYLRGTGVLQDFSQAHMWFNIASSQGHKRAGGYLEMLTIGMSIGQVAEAQKLAREFVAN